MMNQKAVILGGGRGIGLKIAKQLEKEEYDEIHLLGLHSPDDNNLTSKMVFHKVNVIEDDLFSVLDEIGEIQFLFISTGFGRVAPFSELVDTEIVNSVKVNQLSIMRVIHYYYPLINSNKNFYCGIMGSIAGLIVSPLFSVYGATKAALCKFIESINIELIEQNAVNRILNVSPGRLEGTSFHGQKQNLSVLEEISKEIIDLMYKRETLFIPRYEETYKQVLLNYNNDALKFGRESYKYKINSGDMNHTPQVKVGYLSGTFDLFHIGHLNLLRRAKQYCDYLVVGVHSSGAWKGKDTFISLEERMEIVRNIKHVDEVIHSFAEDIDAYESVKYDYLFVGSDYQGSERFRRYEEFFANTSVQIIYFPYTKSVSSTHLRKKVGKKSTLEGEDS